MALHCASLGSKVALLSQRVTKVNVLLGAKIIQFNQHKILTTFSKED